MQACQQQEPAVSDEEADRLLKSIFRDHALADYPDFVRYFKNERQGKPLEERLLRKAAAAYTAAQHAHHAQQQQAQAAAAARAANPQQQQHPSRPAPGVGQLRAALGWLSRGLARYRAWPPRVRLHLLLSSPEYSPLAMAIGLFMMAVIVLNTITFCIESVPAYEGTRTYDKLLIIDYVCLGIFTAEFLLRLATCSSFRRFARKPMNLIDLAAIAPFLLELAIMGPDSQNASQTRIFRLIRLVRIMRLLRASSKFRNLQLVVDALAGSMDVMGMLAVLLGVLLVVAGSVVYYIEDALVPGTWFDSIPLTIYYMHVTLTTTGYGDYYAQSAWGRFVVGFFMLLCMVTVSLPIGVVGGNFSGLWSRYCALRDAMDRSVGAWATRAALRGRAARHCAAVDELITATNRVKAVLDEGSSDADGLRVLRDKVAGLQIRLQLLAAEGEDPARLAPLRESVSELRRKLWEASDRFGQLQALLALVGRISSAEVAASLDGLHAVHQALAKRGGEGARAAARAREMMGELRAMREVVRAEEEEVYGAYDGGGDGEGGAAGDVAVAQKKE